MKLPERLLLATSNTDKVDEWRERLGLSFDWSALPEVSEDADSYEGNAALKAISAAQHTGRIALGDDSGLEVDAYDGAPGLFTRRWAAERGGWQAALASLCREAAGSRARFCCGLAVAWPDGSVLTALGTTTGVISDMATQGHGLEPCFRADGTDQALCTLEQPLWEEIHYRSRAWRALQEQIKAL